MSKTMPWRLVPALLLLLGAAQAAAQPEPIETIGAGQRIDLVKHLVPGKVTIFEFFSGFCPSCAYTTPKIERLAREFPDFVLRKIDINRPGVLGPDYHSPVARQYGLTAIPHFKIYGPEGQLRVEGREAYRQALVWHWYFVEKQGKEKDPAGRLPPPEE